MASRLTVAVLFLALATACSTTRVVLLNTGQGAPLEYRPPTSNKSVEVDEEDFEDALSHLVLDIPLTIRPAQQGWLVHTSYPSNDVDTRWQHLMRKSFGSLCRPRQPREDCLSLLDDVMGMSKTDKLVVALGLSIEPMRESIARAVEKTLTPQFFVAAISAGMVTWAILAANPEPVFTKAAAIISAVMVIYLGVDAFLEVLKACFELKQASDRAVTFEELKEASQRFGTILGDQGTRVFILAVAVLVSRGTMGGASWLAARMPLLPHFAEASAVGSSQVGVKLADVGQVSVVAVVEGKLALTLAPTAVAMVAQGKSGGGSTAEVGPAVFRSWGSFSGLKSALGPAGKGKQWHHIVEQTPGNVERFGPHALHNTQNVIALDEALHIRVSAFYSRLNWRLTGSQNMTIRQWLSTQSYDAQREFGLRAIENIKKGIWL
jgi:hypothetical protein